MWGTEKGSSELQPSFSLAKNSRPSGKDGVLMEGLILEYRDCEAGGMGPGVLVCESRCGKLYLDTFIMTGYSTSNKTSM